MNCECAVITCKHNERFNNKYGYCRSVKNIVLKFRMAGDFGKGTIVFLECLNQELPQDSEVTDAA
jgi:hypothetical protein